jgi:hypothetical protein
VKNQRYHDDLADDDEVVGVLKEFVRPFFDEDGIGDAEDLGVPVFT